MTMAVIGIPTGLTSGQDGRVSEYRIGQDYCQAITFAGGIPLLIPLLTDEELLRPLYEHIDGLLLAGGGDVAPEYYQSAYPALAKYTCRERDQVEMTLARWALAENKPILGICRGIQMLNVAAGGTLIEDVQQLLPGTQSHQVSGSPLGQPAHTVTLEPASLLRHILGNEQVSVNSRHHQAVRDVALGFRVVAHSPDGIIEAIEFPPDQHPFAVGVQWHPENMISNSEAMRRLFRYFVQACARESSYHALS